MRASAAYGLYELVQCATWSRQHPSRVVCPSRPSFRNSHHLLPALISLVVRVVVCLSLSLALSETTGQMSDVYVPSSMASIAPPPTRFSSVNLHRRAAAAVFAAGIAAGAWAATTSAQATAAEDIIIGVRYSAAVVDCHEDTIDKITLQLVVCGSRAIKLYTCFRGLRLAIVWFAGRAFSEGLRMRASTLLGRASAAAAAGEVLLGPGGGESSRPRNVTAGAAADSQAVMVR
ncbi:unnamed protein product [Ectocarpus sp. 12 AP-2014]